MRNFFQSLKLSSELKSHSRRWDIFHSNNEKSAERDADTARWLIQGGWANRTYAVRVANIWGRWFPAPLDGDMAPRNTPFPMCFHFDRHR